MPRRTAEAMKLDDCSFVLPRARRPYLVAPFRHGLLLELLGELHQMQAGRPLCDTIARPWGLSLTNKTSPPHADRLASLPQANGARGPSTWGTVRPCLSVSNAFRTRRQLKIRLEGLPPTRHLSTFIMDSRIERLICLLTHLQECWGDCYVVFKRSSPNT